MLEQQYYTSSPTGMDGRSGFGVLAQSPSMQAHIAASLEAYARYGKPYTIDDADLETMPVSISFYAIGPGVYGMTHCKYTGKDYSGRWGNFFAHSISFTDADIEAVRLVPASLCRSPLWVSKHDGNSSLTTAPAFAECPEVTLDTVHAFVTASKKRMSAFAAMFQSLLSIGASGRRVILVDKDVDVIKWIEAVTFLLPPSARRLLSFSTYQRDPYKTNLSLVATRVDGDFRFTSAEYQFQFAVFQMLEERWSEATIGPVAQLLTTALFDRDDSVIKAFGEMADRLQVEDLRELENVAAIFESRNRPARVAIDTLRMAQATLQGASQTALSYAWDVAHELTHGMIAVADFDRLSIILPAYHALSIQLGKQTFFQDDLQTVLRGQIRTDTALDALKFFRKSESELPLATGTIEKGMRADDWCAMLDRADTGESVVSEMWSYLREAALSAARRREFSVWRKLMEWSSRHGTAYALQRLKECVEGSEWQGLPVMRMIVDTADSMSARFPHAYFDVCVALFRASINTPDKSWQNDLQRCTDAIVSAGCEKELLPALLRVTGGNAEALHQALRDLISIDHTLSGLAARELAGSDTVLSNAFLKAAIADESLITFLQEMWTTTYQANRAVRYLRALLDNVPDDRTRSAARALAGCILDVYRIQSATIDRYRTLLTDVPEVKAFDDQYGVYLADSLSLSGITVLTDPKDLQSLDGYLKKLEFVKQRDLRAFLTNKLSQANQRTQVPAGAKWGVLRVILQIPEECAISADDYKIYLTEAINLVIKSKSPCVTDATIFDSLGRLEHLPVFAEEFERYLNFHRRESDIFNAVGQTVFKIAQKSGCGEAALDPASRLVKCLNAQQKAMLADLLKSQHQDDRQLLAWWDRVYQRATRNILQKLIGR